MEVREFVQLSEYTTFHVGGPARYFFDIPSLTKLKEAVLFAEERHLPILVIGDGSNLLISDDGFPGVVLHITIPGIEWDYSGEQVHATVSAGVYWDAFVEQAVRRGYWGVENLSGIPGTVGASAVQNIGAYGASVDEIIEWVEIYDKKYGMVRRIPNNECQFDYRDSMFKRSMNDGMIITGVRFRLQKSGVANLSYKDLADHFANSSEVLDLRMIRDAVLSIRNTKFPDLLKFGTAGSFFKNPIVTKEEADVFVARFPDASRYVLEGNKVKLGAAWIIDHALGMRGMRHGNVGTWDKQALVIVNYGGATEKEIRSFAHEIQYRAAVKTNILLPLEVVYVKECQ